MTLPISTEYSVGSTTSGEPCVVITSQKIDWDGISVGKATESAVTIPEIEQLVGFCLRCGNNELFTVPGSFYEYIAYVNPGPAKKMMFSVSMNKQKKEASAFELDIYQKIIASLQMP